ncbi:[protein-PII] uridylyltransferase [Candidatus Poriferisodalis sp.]|uniref:[protein-PII] uridylyltransferase n=1 Tax=Candidatus Poriferisodalis sp. TaxID=3101277 RepID=UPI003B01B1ED
MTSFGEQRAALVATADASELPASLSSLTDAWLAERFTAEAVVCGLADPRSDRAPQTDAPPDRTSPGSAPESGEPQASPPWVSARRDPSPEHKAVMAGAGVALVAVGGYGRGELCPGSDIDLLLVHDDIDTGSFADRIWYPIWDEKLKLGHAVRSLAATLELAASDIDTATAIADARHLAGDELLTERLINGVKADWRDNATQRLEALQRAVRRRHSRNGEVAFLLEPDLKAGRGGLRDAHAIRWARLAGAQLPSADTERLDAAYRTLLRIRTELHRTVGWRSDVLSADDQDGVAERLGAADADALMAEVAAAGRIVAFLSDQLWSSVARQQAERVVPEVDVAGLSVRDGELVIDGDPATDVVLVLHAAVQSARGNVPISRASLDKLSQRQAQFPDPWPQGARSLFVELLRCGHKAVGVIETLDYFDVWTRVLPEWAPNRHRPQRSRYHRFTVDRHLLEAVAEAARLTHRVARPDLLLMGALLHDLGKGYPGDHTQAGMRLAGPIARRCGWRPDDADTLVRLVQHHLLLTDVATRRDLDDPLTVATVARAVQTSEFLELLAAMTEADCLATGPMAWGDWTASLVTTLVELTAEHLSGADPAPSLHHRLHRRLLTEEVMELMAAGDTAMRVDNDVLTVVAPDERGLFSRAAGVLALRGLDVLQADAYSSPAGMAVSSFRIVPPETPVDWERVVFDVRRSLRGHLALEARIAERARVYRRRRALAATRAATSVTFDAASATGATIVEVRTEDHIGVLYKLTRVLAEMGLDIRSAKIQTLANEVVDSFYVVGPDGPVIEEAHQREVELALRHALD